MTSQAISRRRFLSAAAGGALVAPAEAARATGLQRQRQFGGKTLAGWETNLGDGIYAAPGEPPVSDKDIATIHRPDVSEMQANVKRRRIMAHNITFKRILDDQAFDVIHTCGYSFRLPYLPSPQNQEENAQTLEGGLVVWDGKRTRRDYGVMFQWDLNPNDAKTFGDIHMWIAAGKGRWQTVGKLKPDMAWHTLRIVLDFPRRTTSLLIDDTAFPSCLSAEAKPADWGRETAARLQAEIISEYPGEHGRGYFHHAYYRDWLWTWERPVS